MLDLVTPSVQQLERAVDAIETSISRGSVLVCCALGFSRSAIAVAAWLLRTRRARSAADAISQIRRARPAIVLRAHHATLMDEFARRAVG